MKHKKALIVGINGFVGAYLERELVNHGYEVYGCDCVKGEAEKKDFFYLLDITDFDAVYELISTLKPTHIFNLAAVSSVGLSWEIPQKTVNINVCGTINLLESVKRLELPTKVLLIGSSEEYAPSNKPVSENDELEAVNPYGISRIMIEEFAKIYRNRYGLDITCIRAFNHTGIGQLPVFVLPSFIDQVSRISYLKKPGTIKVGNIAVYRDFSDVRDIVNAYRLIAECNAKINVINVGSGVAYKIEDLLKYIISLSDQPIEIVFEKERFRPADLPYCCCNNALLREKTGWRSQYDIFKTLREMYQKKLLDFDK